MEAMKLLQERGRAKRLATFGQEEEMKLTPEFEQFRDGMLKKVEEVSDEDESDDSFQEEESPGDLLEEIDTEKGQTIDFGFLQPQDSATTLASDNLKDIHEIEIPIIKETNSSVNNVILAVDDEIETMEIPELKQDPKITQSTPVITVTDVNNHTTLIKQDLPFTKKQVWQSVPSITITDTNQETREFHPLLAVTETPLKIHSKLENLENHFERKNNENLSK
jgi:hypothetical protein